MTIDLSDPLFDWCNDVWAAQRGNVDPLANALRSDRPIDAHSERMLRDCLASLLSGEHKRKRGRPKARPSIFDDMHLAEDLVRTYKAWARAKGFSHSVEKALIEEAVRRYGVSEEKLRNRLHRARK